VHRPEVCHHGSSGVPHHAAPRLEGAAYAPGWGDPGAVAGAGARREAGADLGCCGCAGEVYKEGERVSK
jgi:hypothetical protein